VLTDRDIVIRPSARKESARMTASEVMSRPVVTVTPETKLEDCCRMLETSKSGARRGRQTRELYRMIALAT